MLSTGGSPSPGRPWPAKTHLSWTASKREAKISSLPNGLVSGSYQVAQGTARPVPAKSIEGASASLFWSKLSELRKVGEPLEAPLTVPCPFVTQLVPLKAREKICCSPE